MDSVGDAYYRRGLACLLFGIALEIGGVVFELDFLVRTSGASFTEPSLVPVAMAVGGLLVAFYGICSLWG